MTNEAPLRNEALRAAEAWLAADRPAEAMAALAPYLASTPDDPRALCLAACAQLGLERSYDALSSAKRASVLDPEDEWPLRLVSVACGRLGRSTEAIAAAKAAVRVAPDEWRAHLQVGQARLVTGRLTEEAWDALTEAVRLAPDEPGVHRTRGLIASGLDRRRDAEAAFREALRLDPRDAVSRHELARLTVRRGGLAAATAGFSNAVALDPELQVGVRNLELVTARVVRVGYACAIAGTVAVLFVRPRPLAAAIATAVALIGVAWFWRRTGGSADRFLRSLPARSPWLVTFAALTSLAWALLWLVAFVPVMVLASIAVLIGASWAHQAWRIRWRTRR